MGVLLGTCAIVGAAACADAPTAVQPSPGATAALERGAAHGRVGGVVEVVCSISYATPGGPYAYRYGRLLVKLPAASRAADGSTRQYRYRGYAQGQRVVFAANCTIPNTEQAFRQMNRRLGVKETHAGKGWKDGGDATTLSDYTLPPLTVNACRYGGDYPECNPPPTYGETDLPPCYDGMEGCDDGGGGSSPEPPAEEEPRPDCTRDANGWCVTRPVEPQEWEQLGKVINSLREDIHECRETKRILQGFHAQGIQGGRFRFWDGKDLDATRTTLTVGYISSDVNGRIIVYDSYWALRDKGTVVHEGLHVYLNNINSPIMGSDNEIWVDEWEVTCAS